MKILIGKNGKVAIKMYKEKERSGLLFNIFLASKFILYYSSTQQVSQYF